MKKMLILAFAVALVLFTDSLPFTGTDVAKLHPVEVLIIRRDGEMLSATTDSSLVGVGMDVSQAIIDLKEAAPGQILLDTVNYLLLTAECTDGLDSLFAYLRPACQVYYLEGEGDLTDVGEYLQSHPSGVTLLACKQGERAIPTLTVGGEVYRIAE